MEKKNNDIDEIKSPPLHLYATEAVRAMGERVKSFKFRRHFKPKEKGDNHPVLVIPGFMTNDVSTRPLRKFLKRMGYAPHKWNRGRNYGNLEDLKHLAQQIDKLYEEHQQKISLIGWSLGGVYARQLAKEKENKVRQLITLGSPFNGVGVPNNAAWIYKLISNGEGIEDLDPEFLADLPIPAPVPTTAIYTKDDGVVAWQSCMEKVEDETHQNIEVKGSHFALGFNPSVLYIITDRLHYNKRNWKYFKFEEKKTDLLFYPSL